MAAALNPVNFSQYIHLFHVSCPDLPVCHCCLYLRYTVQRLPRIALLCGCVNVLMLSFFILGDLSG